MIMRRSPILPTLGLALLGALTLGQQSCPLDDNIQFVTARDGVQIATEVWSLPQPAPTILMRTPYGRLTNLPFAEVYNVEGWALASQDLRGTH